MSWIEKLYQTYEKALQLDLNANDKLAPISHTQQNAHIKIAIDGDGNFRRADVMPRKTVITLPSTEKSASRSSGEAPHPLADKIQYVAKDYEFYSNRKPAYFSSYRALLLSWCESDCAHKKAKAVYAYINKGEVIKDLIMFNIIRLDPYGKLAVQWDEGALPDLFQILPKEKGKFDQSSALICWTVEYDGEPDSETWKDQSLQKSWIDFEASAREAHGLCYVKGIDTTLANIHPAKIRHNGDKAKLISFNDTSNYTYRGKFDNNQQAAGVSFEVTQKAHNALRWLLERQGFKNGDQRIVAWAVSGKSIPDPLVNPIDNEEDEIHDEISTAQNYPPDIGQSYALKLNKKMEGYRARLDDYEIISILCIDSATPGRMGISYYYECFAKDFINRIENWNLDFSWQQRYKKSLTPLAGNKKRFEIIWSVYAPCLKDICQAAFGETVSDSLKKNLYERLMPCIIESRAFPLDILNHCLFRVTQRTNFESWEWENNLGVACALYRGFYRRHPVHTLRRNYSMSLEIQNTSRDYLYGRLLAVAERIEKKALNMANEKRMTSAERLMQRFADRPYSTWRNIELSLNPYKQRLKTNHGGFLTNRNKELDEIMATFKNEDFMSDKKLSGEFLLGYHCQKQYENHKQTEDN